MFKVDIRMFGMPNCLFKLKSISGINDMHILKYSSKIYIIVGNKIFVCS
jgi:hypothetical protein